MRGQDVAKSEVLAIGDSVRTDIAGAAAFGIASLFIGQGIHCDVVAPKGVIDAAALDGLFGGDAPQAEAAMMTLRW